LYEYYFQKAGFGAACPQRWAAMESQLKELANLRFCRR